MRSGNPNLDTLDALALRVEPKANGERHVGLCSQISGGGQRPSCAFTYAGQNIVPRGSPDTGKTGVETAREIQAIAHHLLWMWFFASIERINAPKQEKAKAKAGPIAERLARLDLIILDELCFRPFGALGGLALPSSKKTLRAQLHCDHRQRHHP